MLWFRGAYTRRSRTLKGLDSAMIENASNLLLHDLKRPEYVPYPEGFLSDMYWSIFSVDGWEDRVGETDSRILGLIYDSEGQDGGKKVFLQSTRPTPDDERWPEGLRSAGLSMIDHRELKSRAITASLLGVRAGLARRRPSSPLSPNIALLQNRYGIFAKSGPPNLVAIVEEIYRLGALSNGVLPENVESASSLLVRAAQHRLDQDDFLRTIDQAVMLGIFPNGRVEARPQDQQFAGLTEQSLLPIDNPFSWFYRSWNRLTSNEWIDALPAKRWSDWATTLIRNAVGFGYLWEMRWCELIARRIIAVRNGANADDSLRSICRSMQAVPLVSWEPTSSSVERRDVASSLKALVERGVHVRRILADLIPKENTEETVDKALARISGNSDATEQLALALERDEGFTSPAKNLWETVRYALGIRLETGQFADHYGLLRRRGKRYLMIDPDTEWIAVVASMACGSPSLRCTLSEVRSELSMLGLEPSVSELLLQLERSGLARSSPDADDAVYVEAAFNA